MILLELLHNFNDFIKFEVDTIRENILDFGSPGYRWLALSIGLDMIRKYY